MANWDRGRRGGRGWAYSSDLGDDAEDNGVPHQRDEMVEMIWQIAALIETVQCLLPPSKGSNGSKYHQLDDSFDALHRRRAHSQEFDSKLN
ncbi:hypothetical protein CsSME_00011322 [Camellia sinensis var. sinensis]